MKIINQTKSTTIARQAIIADTLASRMIGLLNRSALADDEALVITRCQSIHMLFMRFPIDVIFIDGDYRVVGLLKHIKPFRLSPIFFKARSAIETSINTIEKSQTEIGDVLTLGNGSHS